MTLPHERLLRALGAPDHSLPDGCIEPTDINGWCRFLVALHRSGWPVTLDGQAIDRLLEPDDLRLPEYRLTIKVWPGGGSVQINVFPGSFESIDFDFSTIEIVDQAAADALSDFIRLAGQAVGKTVALSPEGSSARVVATYDPDGDDFWISSNPKSRQVPGLQASADPGSVQQPQ